MAEDNRQLALVSMDAAIARVFRSIDAADEEAFYASVAESLWWITTLDEALWELTVNGVEYEEYRLGCERGRLIPGLRYARNRQVHDVLVTGMQGNPLLNLKLTWIWRRLDEDEVPDWVPETKRGEEQQTAFDHGLAENLIYPSLADAAAFLTKTVPMVDGPV